MDKKQICGVAAGALLILGAFLPVFSVPFIGTVSYFNNGSGDGVIVLCLGVGICALALLNKPRLIPVIAAVALVVCGFSVFRLIDTIKQAKESAQTELAGNPFAPLGEAVANSMQIQWGWAILFAGALVGIISHFVKPAAIATAAQGFPIAQGFGRYKIDGVDRATKFETTWYCDAQNGENARAKAELEGIVVTSVTLEPAARAVESKRPASAQAPHAKEGSER